MKDPSETIEQLIQTRFESLTRAERQLANTLLEDYPAAGLASVTTVAQNAQVSTPTVVRMVQKLGFGGFADFQNTLREELSARISDPMQKHEAWSRVAPDSHLLNRFSEAIEANLRQTVAQIDPAAFDAVARLLSDPKRSVFVAGGRITRSLGDYLFNHLQVIRPDVTQIGAAPGVWPHFLLDAKPGDVMVLFDIRRYENTLLRLADIAHDQGAKIVLITDQWGSPISKVATHKFNCRVEAPSAWDSNVAIMLLVETLIAAVQELGWSESETRMKALEEMFDRTRLFRKFV
jgi:DNA-binding MurR/RpiR family transcriptional regulator